MQKLPFRRTANRIEWRRQRAAATAPEHPAPGKSALLEQVNRKKARWLKRVMYETKASSTAKCFAYAVVEHLNCVTMDSWPAQERIARLLNRKCTKTARRAAKELERLGLLIIKRDCPNRLRYAPIFTSEDDDKDKIDAPPGDNRPNDPDKKDNESNLPNLHQESAPTGRASVKTDRTPGPPPEYDPRLRGSIELKIAAMLGENGMLVLQKLGEFDDRSVDRLCRAYAEGSSLTKRELSAAVLAVQQLGQR
jgi:hypothetical protein